MSVETPKNSTRLLSLDVFRGMTVAGMVLVNNPGTWSAVYAPLKHAEWHGWTPTDFVFPFFLFIVGIAIPIALGKRLSEGVTNAVYWKIIKRAALIFLLGLIQMGFPFFDLSKTDVPLVVKIIGVFALIAIAVLFFADKFREAKFVTIGLLVFFAGFYLINQGFPTESFARLRIPGVLQRIAVCYLFASFIFLWTNWKQQAYIAGILLLLYWVLMLFGGNGDLSAEGNFSGYIDRLILGENHIWKANKFYDPEGTLSTMPAVATTLIGVLTGTWLKTNRSDLDKVSGMFFFGVVLTALGWIWDFWFPINKPLWTSSYVLFTGGLGLCFLAFCYFLIDIKNYKNYWTKPFIIFGTNALALYFASSLLARLMLNIKWANADGKTTNVQKWIFDSFFAPLASPINASLIFALVYILFWLFLMWLLYRKKIFIKV